MTLMQGIFATTHGFGGPSGNCVWAPHEPVLASGLPVISTLELEFKVNIEAMVCTPVRTSICGV